jgi:uncharacterized membrane protein
MMDKGRLEAFSDGVIAIIITIMVLELKVPHVAVLGDLAGLAPIMLSYVLSFVTVGIYWVNHHHLMHVIKNPNGAILWANLHFLFWLSLMPFTTGLIGENYFTTWPVVIYSVDLMGCALSYAILAKIISRGLDDAHEISKLIRFSTRDRVAVGSYIISIPLAFYHPWMSTCLFFSVAFLYFVPDRRIEKALAGHAG